MNLKYTVLIASGVLLGSAAAYSVSSPDRRSFLVQSASSIATTALPFVFPAAVMAEGGDDDGFMTTESGLRYKVITEGTGAVPSPGQTVKAHYTGKLVCESISFFGLLSCLTVNPRTLHNAMQ
jgi:hypothetical protein